MQTLAKNQTEPGGTTRSGVSTVLGVTWIRRIGASLALVAMAASVAGSPSPSEEVVSQADVGQLNTSMVDMLGDDHEWGDDDNDRNGSTNSSSGVVTMSELRRDVLGKKYDGGDGTGIDVALIDTGVAPVDGLDGPDKVVHGPDLSFEGTTPEAAYLDTFGHGTHMAGVIAGDREGAEGIAPGARIVSVKVAGHDGITTVPQVVAAIDWVVDHHDSDGLNIRVLNLSLGQAGVDDHVGDHLSAAVERAWDAGIVVVVAAGNRGEDQAHLDSPAIDPYVIAVGGVDSVGGKKTKKRDIPEWSATGDGDRNPDAVAQGRSIASYRVPGSTVDIAAPGARYRDGFFLGSGTSQSAAVTSGVVAALLSDRPELTPDQVKATIEHEASDLSRKDSKKQGNGHLDGEDTIEDSPQTKIDPQNFPAAAGPGTGIIAPTGATWSGGTWSGGTWSGATWSGATWSGGTWSGATWSGATWSGATWSGATWSGATWSGATWSGATWSGATWSGATWSGTGWD